VGVTCIVEGLRGLVEALASEGTSLSEVCLEFIVVGPFTGNFVLPFVWSDADRVPPNNFANPILSNDVPALWVLAD
jgi:hypothetical protein